MKTFSSLVSACGLLFLGLVACSGGGSSDQSNDKPSPTPDYTVTISPTSASLPIGKIQQFKAQVAATTNSGVTWSVYGTGNCEGATCGTVTSDGVYTAPSLVPSPAYVYVKATSKDNTQDSATAVVTILAGVAVSVSPNATNVPVSGTQQFTAVVVNTTNTAVDWSLSGAGCIWATCGTVTTAGLYTAPSAVPDPATVTVKATSQADPTKSGTATVIIGGTSLDKLSGTFTFLLNGFDASGAMQTAGILVADGNGHLTNGVQDINRKPGASAHVPFSGTYSLGADNRGEMVLTSSMGTSIYRFALNEDATEARMIEFDDTGTRSSGMFISQNPVNFSTSTVTGDYVLSLSGTRFDSDHIAAVGRFHADGAGNFTDGQWDFADGTPNPPAMASWTGTYAVDSVGRGTAVLNIPGMGALQFCFYVGYTNHNVISEPPALFFVSMDPLGASTPMLSGPVSQAYPTVYSNDSWPANGALKVFALAGSIVGFDFPTGLVGTFEADGAGNLLNGIYDRNILGMGSIIGSSLNFGGTYSIGPSGRGTGTLQLSPTLAQPIIFYLATPDRGVVMASPGIDAAVGSIWSMGGGGAPGDPSVFSGDYVMGPFAFPSIRIPSLSGVMRSDGVGNFSGTQDYNEISRIADIAIAGTYSIGTRGRGVLTLEDGSKTVVYMVSPDMFVAMPISLGDAPAVLVVKR